MRVVGVVILALCTLLIAGLAGAAVFFYLDLGMLESATAAVATFALLALYHTVSSGFGLRSEVSRQLADLSRGGADMGRQVAEMGRRLAALESKLDSVLTQARAITDPLSIQLGDFETRLLELAEKAGMHQATVDALARSSSEQPAKAAPSPAPKLHESSADRVGAEPAAVSKDASVESIRSAIQASRIDLYLQPIVTLPRRKVRFYEAMSRLRSESGESVQESEFVPQAERAGLMPEIDHLVIFRCVQIVRRLLMKNREIGVFCSLSRTTLSDPDSSQRLYDFMSANRAIASSLIFQFAQSAVREMAENEYARLSALSQLGFGFCLQQVSSLRLEPEELAPRGFRHVMLHAPLLLGRDGSVPRAGGPGELSELLGRFGIELIVDRIENESTVMELLDHEVRYGQGPLFSEPRPVRAEALQAMPNIPDADRERLSVGHLPINSAAPSAYSMRTETHGAEPSGPAELPGGVVGLG
ncbi:MAG TPA: EAL domain-containing protein [Xanthobacteraceae bacterium]|jgi:cyclic-di-GMP phosphodiesterase TipF (flagellum assembly factor)